MPFLSNWVRKCTPFGTDNLVSVYNFHLDKDLLIRYKGRIHIFHPYIQLHSHK